MKKHNYDENLLAEIGKTIAYLREIKGISQSELSKDICTKSTLSKIENGNRKIPDVILLSKISKKLGLSFETIFTYSENKINDLSKEIKKQIYKNISLGKYQKAKLLCDEYINPNNSEEDLKYFYYVKGTIEFYNHNFEIAKKYFLFALSNVELNTYVTSFVDVLLLNGYFVCCSISNNFTDKVFDKLFEVFNESLEYYMIFDLRQMIRFKLSAVDIIRLRAKTIEDIKVCEKILNRIELVIEENEFIELKIDLNIINIIILIQYEKIEKAKELIDKTRSIILSNDLYEINNYFENRMESILTYIENHEITKNLYSISREE